MKLSYFFLIGMLAFGLAACGADEEPAATAAPATPITTPPAQAAPANGGAVGAVNPPHGEPGHRCDISVGAPLDGSAAPQQPTIDMSQMGNGLGQPNIQSTTVTPTTPTNTNTGAAAGNLNPAHGQPGHRCDIAVGAPLN